MSPNAVVALALIAGTAATVVQLARAQRKLKRLENEARKVRRLEDQVCEVRRQVEVKKAELEIERRRAEWKELKWRKSGGPYE